MPHLYRHPPVTLSIERQHVEAQDVLPVFYFFHRLKTGVSEPAILSLLGFLTISVEGYDEDCQVWQRSEVRAWFREVEQLTPQLVYYLALDTGMLTLFYLATRASWTPGDPQAYTTPEDVAAFLDKSVASMNWYLSRCGIDYHSCDVYYAHCDAVAKAVSARIGPYLH